MSKKGPPSSSLHKVIMVGSGGVGKSALTLQVGPASGLDVIEKLLWNKLGCDWLVAWTKFGCDWLTALK